MEESLNLSEILFKPKFVYPETSVISNSGVELPALSREDISFGFVIDFYRPVLKFEWVFSGGSALDIDEALAKICVSKNVRSRDSLHDTVKEYGSGHWNFEFNSIAQNRVNKAHECERRNDVLGASHNYRLASRYFAIAAYPFLKSDTLAQNSDTLCRTTYKKMYDIDPSNGILQEHFFNVDGKKVSGYLHLPDLKQVYPCVIIICPYESNFSYAYRFINDYLAKANICAFVLEMPGAGACEKLNLNDHFSMAIEAAIDYLGTLKYIDATNIGLYGSGIAGTACIRAAILKSSKVRALALLAPYVHSFFTDQEILDSMPLCLRSSLCNRLDLDAKDWDTLTPQFKVFSLKEQGILSGRGGCKIPTYASIVRDSVVSKEDITLLENNFSDITVKSNEKIGRAEFIRNSIIEVTKFFSEKFSSGN